MARVAALVLAFGPAAAAWVLWTSVPFDGILVLGILAVSGGVWTLAQRLPRDFGVVALTFACATFLGTTGLHMRALAGSFRPFSTWTGFNQKDLVELEVPIASSGEWALDKAKRARVIVNITRLGEIVWRSRAVSLEEFDAILESARPGTVLIRADKDLPYQHVGWLAAIAAAHGRDEVLLGVDRFSRSPAEAEVLGAELSWEHWPALELALPIAPAAGPRVRIVATAWRETLWPPPNPFIADQVSRSRLRVSTAARYEIGDRATGDIRELAAWIAKTPPAALEPDPAVQLKFVVAVENEIRKAGHPPAALVLPAPPTESVRKAEYLPYPEAE